MVILPVHVNGIWERTAGNGERENAVTSVTGVRPEVHSRTGQEDPQEEERYSSTLSLTSALDGGGWSAPCPGRFTPGKDPVPIVQEAGWAPGPVVSNPKSI